MGWIVFLLALPIALNVAMAFANEAFSRFFALIAKIFLAFFCMGFLACAASLFIPQMPDIFCLITALPFGFGAYMSLRALDIRKAKIARNALSPAERARFDLKSLEESTAEIQSRIAKTRSILNDPFASSAARQQAQELLPIMESTLIGVEKATKTIASRTPDA